MHIEFIDLLRCPRPHEETWLVAAFYRMNGREVVEGKLGCHVCGAEFPIRDGIAYFRESQESAERSRRVTQDETDEARNDAMRIAAFLDLVRPGTLALLTGDWANASDSVAALTSSRIIALNSALRAGDSERVLQIESDPRLPLATHSLDGIALDAASSTAAMLEEAAHLLRPRGRLLAPSTVALTGKFSELARDADYVVAEYIGDLVSIRR